MTSPIFARTARWSFRTAVATAAVLVVVSVVGGATTVLSAGSDGVGLQTASSELSEIVSQRQLLHAFEAQLQPIIDDGGYVVAMGMRPGVADIADGAFADQVLITMAEGWRASMVAVRPRFAGLDVPSFLSEFARLFDASLDAYVETGDALVAAAMAVGAERARLIEQVSALGNRSDDLFDRAQGELDRHRRRLGLGEDPAPLPGA